MDHPEVLGSQCKLWFSTPRFEDRQMRPMYRHHYCLSQLIQLLFYFPDVYSRMHATGVADTLGSGLILVGLMLQIGWDSALGKLILILLFTLLTSPTISYVLANTAMRNEDEPLEQPPLEGPGSSNDDTLKTTPTQGD